MLKPISLLTISIGKAIFDQKNIKKKESKHEEHEIPGCVTDMLSSLYYVASLPLLPGKTYSFPISDGGPTLTVVVHVEAREQSKLRRGPSIRSVSSRKLPPPRSGTKAKSGSGTLTMLLAFPCKCVRACPGARLLSLCCGLKRNRPL